MTDTNEIQTSQPSDDDVFEAWLETRPEDEQEYVYRCQVAVRERGREARLRTRILAAWGDMLNYLKAHPNLPLPIDMRWVTDHAVSLRGDNQREELANHVRGMGPVDKVADDTRFGVAKRFTRITLRPEGEDDETYTLSYSIRGERDQTCTAKVIGKKLIKRQKLVSQAVYEDEEVLVDNVEWDCSPILAPKPE